MDVLKLKLLENGVEFTEKLFKTEDGIDGINDQIFVSTTFAGWYIQCTIIILCAHVLSYRIQIPGYMWSQCTQAMLGTSFVGCVCS